VVALDRGCDLRRVDRALVGQHAHRAEHEIVAVDLEKARSATR
jgi:hypothetical protein